jgi:hypothetical protein
MVAREGSNPLVDTGVVESSPGGPPCPITWAGSPWLALYDVRMGKAEG